MPLQGDLETFEHAYRAEAPYVADMLGRLAVPSEAVGDAVQDVFIAAFRRWDAFDPERPVRPWLTGFARRVAFRYRRSAARRHRKGAALVGVVGDRQHAFSGEVDARDFLQRFLANLETGHREAFVLTELQGMTAPEAAAALGISAEAVYGRVRSARRQLREALIVDAREPSPRAAALVPPWALLKAQLGAVVPVVAPPGLGIVSVGAIKTFAATVAVGLVGFVVVDRVWVDTAPVTAVPATPTAIAEPDPAPVVVATATQVRPATSDPTSSPTEAAAAASTRTRVISAPAPAKTKRSLAEETELLQAAKAALVRGDAGAALLHLDAHAERYPDGQLADARHRSRIRALCDLGRVSQARGEAHRLARARPGDPLAIEALSICAQPSIQKPSSPEKE